MDILELNEMETSVQDLLSLAKTELEERRLQQQREEQIQKATVEIEQRLKPLLQEIEQAITTFESKSCAESLTCKKLRDKAADLQQRLEEAPLLATLTVDRQMILNEERLLDERQTQQLTSWRQQLKSDLLEMIQEQQDFFSATDAAISIRGYTNDLKAICALEEVVEALIDQINTHSKEGPVARLRGSHEQTLNFIHDKALENRARVERPFEVQPRTRHRSTEKRPNPYSQLEGKVVVFGGHDRLETAIRNRLRDSDINLIWCTAQAGPQLMEQAESHVCSADLVLVVTGYTSHKLTEKATQAAQRSGKSVEMVNTTGMIRLLEAIEYGLKTRLLVRQLKPYSRSA
jgi:hypothetical protein